VEVVAGVVRMLLAWQREAGVEAHDADFHVG
jgi:hypothetical protein